MKKLGREEPTIDCIHVGIMKRIVSSEERTVNSELYVVLAWMLSLTLSLRR